MDKKKPYETPAVETYSSAKILAQLGPAVAIYDQIP
jgi:hypothetical protein